MNILKKLKWAIPIFLFGIILCIPNIKAKAVTTDSFNYEWINPKIYVSKTKDGVTRSERIRIYHRNSDGSIVYCIQPGVNFAADVPMDGYDSNQASIAGMTEEQWLRVNLLAYYGYGYGNHTDSKWYAITQYEIWKVYNLGWDVYWVDSFHGNRINQFEAESQELLNLVDNHYKRPSFNNQTINTVVGDTVKLTDTNGVLQSYDVSVTGASYRKDGTDLYITTNSIDEITVSMTKTSNRFGRISLVYTRPDTQNLLFAGDLDPVISTLKINVSGGTVDFDKTGEKLVIRNGIYEYEKIKLGNVKYNIYADEDIITNDGVTHYKKDELVGTVVTDENGLASLDDLYFGKYYAVEVESSNDNVLDLTKKYFEITKDNLSESLELYNHYPKGKLDFIKYDVTSLAPLPNTKIEIHMVNKNDSTNDVLIGTYVTDENGKVVIDNLPIVEGMGYYITETEAPENYIKDSDKIFFSISDNETVRVSMTNEMIIEVPNTSKNELNINVLVVIGLILGFGALMYVKIKNNKK